MAVRFKEEGKGTALRDESEESATEGNRGTPKRNRRKRRGAQVSKGSHLGSGQRLRSTYHYVHYVPFFQDGVPDVRGTYEILPPGLLFPPPPSLGGGSRLPFYPYPQGAMGPPPPPPPVGTTSKPLPRTPRPPAKRRRSRTKVMMSCVSRYSSSALQLPFVHCRASSRPPPPTPPPQLPPPRRSPLRRCTATP